MAVSNLRLRFLNYLKQPVCVSNLFLTGPRHLELKKVDMKGVVSEGLSWAVSSFSN